MRRIFQVILLIIFGFLIIPFAAQSASYKITVVKGNNQKMQVGKQASEPIILKITDSLGNPAKATVEFKVIKGEARISPPSATTDSTGRVKVYINGGLVPGEVIVKAEIPKMPGTGVNLTYMISLDKPEESKYMGKKPDSGKKPASLKPGEKPIVKTTPKQVVVATPSPAVPPATPIVTETPATKKTTDIEKPGASPAVIIIVNGNNQEVSINSQASQDLKVKVMDADGNPIEGVMVEFAVIDGKATVMPNRRTTDASGIASVQVKVGDSPGLVGIKAGVVGAADLSATFNLVATEGWVATTPRTPTVVPSPRSSPRVITAPPSTPTPTVEETPYIAPDTIKLPPRTGPSKTSYSREPAAVTVVAGNYQTSEPGVRLAQPIVVYVTDGDGNPAFATVNFTVMSGNATIISKEVKTDARGLASTFVVVNSPGPIKIVAEVAEKPGLSTIAYANMSKPEPKVDTSNQNPIIRASTISNTPGFPASIAFYDIRSRNTGNIEKTKVIQLEIGVTDFRNMPVSTAIKFSVLKGDVKILNPIVQTGSDGRGICYVEMAGSMGIFTIEAQSMENPDLRAIFKSGPEIKTSPPPKVVRPGVSESGNVISDTSQGETIAVRPPTGLAPAGKPALIAVVGGGGQRAKIRTRPPEPLTVLVTDADGKPVEGVLVSFFMKTGRAVISTPFSRTNSEGKAKTFITLGKQPGPYEVGVRVRENKELETTIRLEAYE